MLSKVNGALGGLPKRRPFIRTECVATINCDPREWCLRETNYRWLMRYGAFLNNATYDTPPPSMCNITNLRLRSDIFGIDEEVHALVERCLHFDMLPRSPLHAAAWWSEHVTPAAPDTPFILLSRLFSIRNVYATFRKSGQFGRATTSTPTPPVTPYTYTKLRTQHKWVAHGVLLYSPEMWRSAILAVPETQDALFTPPLLEDFAADTQTVAAYLFAHPKATFSTQKTYTRPHRFDWLHDIDLACAERVLGTFEGARVFLLGLAMGEPRMPSAYYEVDWMIATQQFKIPLPTSVVQPETTTILQLVRTGYSAFATLIWRIYHLHLLMEWAVAIDDAPLNYWVQLAIDSHLPLMALLMRYNQWSDEFIFCNHIEIPLERPSAKHPESPEHFADRLHCAQNPDNPPSAYAQSELVARTPYELYYPSALGLECWEEAPDLTRAIIDGHGMPRKENDTSSSALTLIYTLLVVKTLPNRWRVRSYCKMFQRLCELYPNALHIFAPYLRIGVLGNIPDVYHIVRHRPAFNTRLRLWGTFYHELRSDADTFVWFIHNYYFTYSFLLREAIDAAVEHLPAVHRAFNCQFPYDLWAGCVITGANIWRERAQWLPVNDGSVVNRRALEIHHLEVEQTLDALYSITVKHCHVPESTRPFAFTAFDWMNNIYQTVRKELTKMVGVTPRNIAKVNDAPKNTSRRLYEVYTINDTITALRLTMGWLPDNYNDDLLRTLARLAATNCSPFWLPTFFLPVLGVSEHALSRFREWMFHYNLHNLPKAHYQVEIRQLWLQQPASFCVLWRYLLYYKLFKEECPIPLTKEIATHQWVARHHIIGAQINTLHEPSEAYQINYYYCNMCCMWAHSTSSRGHLMHYHDGSNFLDPVDVIQQRAFNTDEWTKDTKIDFKDNGPNVNFLGIYGTAPTATTRNGQNTLAVHALNARGNGLNVGIAAGARDESFKRHASNITRMYYDTGQFKCGRPRSKHPTLILQIASLAPFQHNELHVASVDKQQARKIFHEQATDLTATTPRPRPYIPKKKKPKPIAVPTIEHLTQVQLQRTQRRELLRVYLNEQAKNLIIRSPTRARRCNNALVPFNLLGHAVTLWGRTYVACSMCACLMIAEQHRYIADWGWVCVCHAVCDGGFDPIHGNLIASPQVTSQARTTLEHMMGPGHVRINPVQWLTRAEHTVALPLPWLTRLGFASFDEFVMSILLKGKYHSFAISRLYNSAEHHKHSLIVHSSNIGNTLTEQTLQYPAGATVLPPPTLRCDYCSPTTAYTFTIPIPGSTQRVCSRHARKTDEDIRSDC